MTVSAEAVANLFLLCAKQDGQRLTNMQVQKLVYIAHGYSLALLEAPLIYNDVKAWQYGPVYPKLYKKLRKYGAGEVSEPIPAADSIPIGSREAALVQEVWRGYRGKGGSVLSAMTHREGTPWSQIWKQTPHADIPDELIKAHYKSLIARNG